VGHVDSVAQTGRALKALTVSVVKTDYGWVATVKETGTEGVGSSAGLALIALGRSIGAVLGREALSEPEATSKPFVAEPTSGSLNVKTDNG
jgi:hypothetical protein